MSDITSTGPTEAILVDGAWDSSASGGEYFVVLDTVLDPEAIGSFMVPDSTNGGTFSISVSLATGSYDLGGSDLNAPRSTFTPAPTTPLTGPGRWAPLTPR